MLQPICGTLVDHDWYADWNLGNTDLDHCLLNGFKSNENKKVRCSNDVIGEGHVSELGLEQASGRLATGGPRRTP